MKSQAFHSPDTDSEPGKTTLKHFIFFSIRCVHESRQSTLAGLTSLGLCCSFPFWLVRTSKQNPYMTHTHKKWSDGQIRVQTHPSHKPSLTSEDTGSCKVLLHLWSRAILLDREERMAKCIKVEQKRCFLYIPVFARIL